MRNIKLIMEYDGTSYSGFQSQENALGIQGVLEKAIESVTGEKIKLIGSGRTDKGVHALAQVANFFTESSIPAERFVYAINSNLPDDIKIKHSEEVDANFHSRFSARKKRYRYIVYNGKIERPLYRNFSYHISKKLDVEEIRKSLPYFIGTHDFKSFMGPKTKFKDTIRTIYSIELEQNGEFLEFIIEGNNFLRHMVRIIVGTLIFVGIGKIKKEDLQDIINGKDRSLAGITAHPEGLFLEKVYYD
ncbi:tRNA pseudouridine(38-40) synthase TruA [Tissierella creatinophila]|uniref:tRNA pseudouridine synthase A n=1 Tax=Tissierella creatinophila DSM 6911 TaxID=1123403 RepID=A0A1U7M491_TISCR|nr:tRNA pseudouridine(38-40) synthase TruA [Tissierella creatinophila]OLS02111.1 tRNA pseudouridine synthase A [Tissierella creatinophila DSM 6911]